MRKWFIPFLMLGVSACSGDLQDLQEYVESVKKTTPRNIEPMPPIAPFQHEDYVAGERRSPFIAPQPELIVDNIESVKDCLAPDTSRIKEPLEAYALDNLRMKGTVGDQDGLWALIISDDGSLYRVRAGYHMGLYHGLITQIRRDGVDLIELIPDGSGCWTERYTELALVE